MPIVLSSSVLRRVIAHADASAGLEICGLLWGDRIHVRRAQPVANVDPDPRRSFELDPAALIAAHRRARAMRRLRIVGHYHSHPSGDAVPSPRDADAAAPDGMLWLIVAGDTARLWRAVAQGLLHDRFDPAAFAMDGDKRVDKPGTGVRMVRGGPDGGPPHLESIA